MRECSQHEYQRIPAQRARPPPGCSEQSCKIYRLYRYNNLAGAKCPLWDHLIISNENYYSFADDGMM